MRNHFRFTKLGLLAIASASLSVPGFSQSKALWSGSVECTVTEQDQTYQRQEVQTWAITGAAPTQQGAMQVYPATWSDTGAGQLLRAQAAQTNYTAWQSGAQGAASIAVFIRASDGRLIISTKNARQSVYGGISATRQITANGVAQTPTPISQTVFEWMFPHIEADASATVVDGSAQSPSEALSADFIHTYGTTAPLAACRWHFTKGGAQTQDAVAIARQTNVSPTTLANRMGPNTANAKVGAAGNAGAASLETGGDGGSAAGDGTAGAATSAGGAAAAEAAGGSRGAPDAGSNTSAAGSPAAGSAASAGASSSSRGAPVAGGNTSAPGSPAAGSAASAGASPYAGGAPGLTSQPTSQPGFATRMAPAKASMLTNAAAAQIAQISPSVAQAQQTVLVTLIGKGTHFIGGQTTVSFSNSNLASNQLGQTLSNSQTIETGKQNQITQLKGATTSGNSNTGGNTQSLAVNLTVNSVQVTSPTSAVASVTIDPTASGSYTVTATTPLGQGAEVASLPNGFTIVLPDGTLSAAPTYVSTTQAPSVGTQTTGQMTATPQPVGSLLATPTVTANSAVSSGSNSAATGTTSQTIAHAQTTVTTGAQAALLPQLVSASPNSCKQGQQCTIVLTGKNTHFVNGQTTVTYGNGTKGSAVSVDSPTSVRATISIGANDPAGPLAMAVTFPPIPGQSGTVKLTNGFTVVALPALQGWVDLHTHPMSNLAFAGKLFHGAPDSGPTSLMPGIEVPRNTGCRFDVPAGDISEALSQDGPTSGDPFQSKCGDVFRNSFAKLMEVMTDGAQQQPGNATGYPDFTNWPRWNDIRHQKMWWEWVKRARDGGLRVMVALAHNSRLLGETVLVGHPGGPISGVTDDANSADLQIREIAAFVNHHTDVMELAMTSTDLYNIVQRGHIAVVLGIEVDNLGDFNDKQPVSTQMIDNEINRLYGNGVRYIFPIHLTDNVFGDTALYDDMFNMANLRETGSFWIVGCSQPGDQVSWHALGVPSGFPVPPGVSPPQSPNCPGAGTADPNATGNVNVRTPGGLTSLGQYAVKAMMKHGMIVDVDHMSNAAVEKALQIAESVPHGGYPVMSGHSGIRSTADFNKENSRTPAQLKRIACLGGMFGLGTDGARATVWAGQYAQAFGIMNAAFTSGTCTNPSLGTGMVAFGTDMNSLVKSPRPTMIELVPGDAPRYSDIYNPNNPNNTDNSFLPVLARSQSGTRTWDYNNDGVAHYGMLADFIKDVRLTGTPAMGGKDLVDNHLLHSADYFFHMWQKIESQKNNVQ